MTTSTPNGLLAVIRERRRFARRRRPGDVPGSLVFEGVERVDTVSVEVIDYGPDHFDREVIAEVPDCRKFLGTGNPTWLHVTGLHEVEKVAEIGRLFAIPDLLLEDTLHTGSRPKLELIENNIFIQIKILEESVETGALDMQQLSIFLDGKTLVTFCEGGTSVFDPIFRRLKNKRGRLRNRGLGYLLWAILDTVVDHALSSIHRIEQNLIELDEMIQEDHEAVSAAELYALKHEIGSILHVVRPNREIIHALRGSPSDLIDDELTPFLDDLRDHTSALFDECDALREYVAGLREYVLAELNQRMNNVMKVLTCISTIFLPLTFLAGIYGMNFHHMPELEIPWAYPALWAVFLAVGGSLVWIFRRKKWL